MCFHEECPKAEKKLVTQPDGTQGYNWSLPYRVSKLHHDQDNKGNLVSTYDVVFHEEVQRYMVYPDFQKFMADTALDGVNRVMANDKEKVSTDYKIMKNLKCKGHNGEPALMTIKVETDNPLINNMDIEKVDSSLKKEIMATKKEQMMKEEKEKELQRRIKDAQDKPADDIDEEEEETEKEEPRPTGIVQPKYKIVHSFPVDLGDSWGGFQTSKMEHEKMVREKVPTHLTITIDLKWAESMKGANLDINEETLLFEYPELYYLDLNLKYKVNPDEGNAKFDKSKKTLTIKLPVVGLTKDSQKVIDDHYNKYVKE